MNPRTLVIHQPDFIPWAGFIERWLRADHLVILDDAQFLKRGWHHRDRLILNNTEAWFGIPVQQKGSFKKKINEIKIVSDPTWKHKLLKSIRFSYQKYSGFKVYFPYFEEIIVKDHKLLVDINMEFLNLLARLFKIKTPISYSSQIPSHLNSSGRLVELCQEHHGSSYLTGMGSKDYLDVKKFENHDIEIIWHNPNSNVFYPQAKQEELGLSILHSLLKYGEPNL
jgi:hypothetical protein